MYHHDQSAHDRPNAENRGWYDDRGIYRQSSDWTGQHDPRHDQDHGRYQQRGQVRENWDNDLYHHAQHPTHNPAAQQASYQSHAGFPRQPGNYEQDQAWGYGQRQYNPGPGYSQQQYATGYNQRNESREYGQPGYGQQGFSQQGFGQQYDPYRSAVGRQGDPGQAGSYGQTYGGSQGAYQSGPYSGANRPYESAQQRTAWGQQSEGTQSGTAYERGGTYRPSFAGKGPKGYTRSDDRLKDEISDRFMHDHDLDASEIEIEVRDGECTLTGTVDSRQSRFRAEQLADSIMGVRDVTNNLRVHRAGSSSGSRSERGSESDSGTGSNLEAKNQSGSNASGKSANAGSASGNAASEKSESGSSRRAVANGR